VSDAALRGALGRSVGSNRPEAQAWHAVARRFVCHQLALWNTEAVNSVPCAAWIAIAGNRVSGESNVASDLALKQILVPHASWVSGARRLAVPVWTTVRAGRRRSLPNAGRLRKAESVVADFDASRDAGLSINVPHALGITIACLGVSILQLAVTVARAQVGAPTALILGGAADGLGKNCGAIGLALASNRVPVALGIRRASGLGVVHGHARRHALARTIARQPVTQRITVAGGLVVAVARGVALAKSGRPLAL
jgi:hypothetical protein